MAAAAPAPATMTITGVDMNRDGIPDVLQQPAAAVSYAAPAMQMAAPAPAVSYAAPAPAVYAAPAPAMYAAPAAATMTITGVDMNRDGIPDVLQRPLAAVSYAAPTVQNAGPAPPVYTAPGPAVQMV